VTGRSQRELLAALRKAGEAPLAEEADGSPRPEGSRPVRHVQRAAPDRLGRAAAVPNGHAAGWAPELDPAAAVARLRGRRPVQAGRPALDSHHQPTRDDALDPRRQPALGDNGELPGTDQRAARG
jgi:hypothetical protein